MIEVIRKIFIIVWYERKVSPFRIIDKSYARYRKHGYKGMISRLDKEYYRLYPQADRPIVDYKASYKKWIDINEKDILHIEPLKYNPLISIITPTYNTSLVYLQKMFESVLEQTYVNWELCIADDASSNVEALALLRKYDETYTNINVIFRTTNGHISEASNSALSLAKGDYIVFLDHDDTLAPNALYEIAKRLNENPKLDLIYSDEDRIDEKNQRFKPHFKSGWNPDMFFSQNYLCHLVCIKLSLVIQVGGFRVGYEGSQDYDLFLRVCDLIDESHIEHIEKILYHWRAIEGSTAYGSGEKNYAHDAGLKALQDFFISKDPLIKIEDGLLSNTYKVNYPISQNAPLVSIIIPTKDGYDFLSKCIKSIFEKTTYPNYEIIIVDNQTTDNKTLDYLETLHRYHNVTILRYPNAFNYSAINNFAVQKAKGNILCLLNNDIEVISSNWLNEMVSHALRKEIGAVGVKLYYDDETIQHAGIVLGIGGVAGHSHKYFQKNADGYFSRLKIVQNYSAVTGACLVVRKEVYEEVGGLNEKYLTVAFNDVDFCLKIAQKGYRNLWTPYAELYHHESKSRGKEDNEEKQKRFQNEVIYMQNIWHERLQKDKYYNQNLTFKHENFEYMSHLQIQPSSQANIF